eukprot:6086106-Pyramimonas_sp.AAC.1
MAALKALATLKGQLTPTDQGMLESFWTTRVQTAKSVLELAEVVLHCKVKPVKKKGGASDKVKISFAIRNTHTELEEAIIKGLKLMGGQTKVGPAPRGPLERLAQELLKEVEGDGD